MNMRRSFCLLLAVLMLGCALSGAVFAHAQNEGDLISATDDVTLSQGEKYEQKQDKSTSDMPDKSPSDSTEGENNEPLSDTDISMSDVTVMPDIDREDGSVVIEVSTLEEFNASYEVIRSDTSADAYTIVLLDDISGGVILSSAAHEITIDGKGHSFYPPDGTDGTAVDVTAGTLNLKNIVIDGKNKESSSPGVYVSGSTAVLNIYGGTVIKDFKVDNYIGAGVSILRGKVNMYGGRICGNRIYSGSVHAGGGVGVGGNGYFAMYGGTISDNAITSTYFANNFPTHGGGVAVLNGGQFYMHGGTISGNSAQLGAGVSVTHYVSYYTSTFYMDGGVIENNHTVNNRQGISIGGGVGINGYYDNASGLAVPSGTLFPLENVSAAGVYLVGGAIRNNSSLLCGGGVGTMLTAVNGNVPYINGTVIEGNSSYVGGGISAWSSSELALGDKTIICNNTADGEGADIFCDTGNAVTGLPDAAGFNKKLNVTGERITGWYEDYWDARWEPDGDNTKSNLTDLYSDDYYVLIAAHDLVYTVVFDPNHDSLEVKEQKVVKGNKAKRPDDPVREGWKFIDWYEGDDDDSFDFDTPITEDKVLKARWERLYTVTYTDGADSEKVFADKVFSSLASGDATPSFGSDPVRKGYRFIGWSPEISPTVTEDVIYTAQWEKLPTGTLGADTPQTGDNVNYLLLINIIFISLEIMAGTVVWGIKRKLS